MSQLLCFGSEMNAAIVGGLISSIISIIGFGLLIKQNGISKQNQFETTFFNLLNSYREVFTSANAHVYHKTKDIYDVQSIIGTYSNLELFNKLYQLLIDEYLSEDSMSNAFNLQNRENKKIKERHSLLYEEFYEKYSQTLKPYLGSIMNITKFIEINSLKKDIERKYISFLKNQLSDYETSLLYFHYKLSNDIDFKAILKKFPDLFLNINEKMIPYHKYY